MLRMICWLCGLMISAMLSFGCSRASSADASRPAGSVKPADSELRRRLTPLQYEVTQHEATERPFDNAYWNEHRQGLYVDIVSGAPLFSSSDKFDSGTGWPSFTRPIHPEAITTRVDHRLGAARTEVRSALADSHLGHVFQDGPAPLGLRYCMNSASLRFVPLERLEAEGYGAYRPHIESGAEPPPTMAMYCPTKNPAPAASAAPSPSAGPSGPGCASSFEVAVLAGGCFWGMEDLLRKVPGVVDTEVGYAGGTTEHPTYREVKTGRTGHAESVKITFDPQKLTFAALLEQSFFRIHDPTTQNRQGNDIGTQYRSAIFVTSPEQRRIAEEVSAKVDRSGKWGKPIVTEIADLGTFTRAEDYHQDYLENNPNGYSCHFVRDITF